MSDGHVTYKPSLRLLHRAEGFGQLAEESSASVGHGAYAAVELTAPDDIPREAATLSQAATA